LIGPLCLPFLCCRLDSVLRHIHLTTFHLMNFHLNDVFVKPNRTGV
jgi:hypothetical protein